MSLYVMIQGDGRGIHLVPQFQTDIEAQAFADSHSIGGTLMIRSNYIATPYYLSMQLQRRIKLVILYLAAEAERRIKLFDDNLTLATALVLRELNKNGNVPEVAEAYIDARVIINGLTTLAAVNGYDVSSTPDWP